MNLTLPLPINLGNARMHWAEKNRKKKAYWEGLNVRLALGKIEKPPAKPMECVAITFHWYVWNLMDPDNARARAKWILDWLKGLGYIVDDKGANIDYRADHQTIDRKEPRVELEITEAVEQAA